MKPGLQNVLQLNLDLRYLLGNRRFLPLNPHPFPPLQRREIYQNNPYQRSGRRASPPAAAMKKHGKGLDTLGTDDRMWDFEVRGKLRTSNAMNNRLLFLGLLFGLVLGGGVRSAPLPTEDEWTENAIENFWKPESLSKGRIASERNTRQLIGALATGIRITSDSQPATISLLMNRTWDLSSADQLVFAWRSVDAAFTPSQPIELTLWAKNEIGEGRSTYRIQKTPGPQWGHVRLALTNPVETDPQYGPADFLNIFRLDFTFSCQGKKPALVVVDGLHFEASEKKVLERARKLGPLEGAIRPERYGQHLVPLHAPNVTPEQLAGYYAPLTEPPASPHQRWGKPLIDGPIRALILVTLSSEREVVELAQRFDLDYDLVPLAMVVRYNPQVLEDIARNRYEVIITSQASDWPQAKPITDWIVRQVKQGTGWVAINTFSSFGEIEMMAKPTGYSDHMRWHRSQPHWITNPIPIEILPRFSTYKAVPTGRQADILFASEGRPKMAVFEHGKGRVVNLCSGQGHGKSSILPSPLRKDHIRTHFDYWEYEYSLVARSIRWAARREAGITFEPITPLHFNRVNIGQAIFTVQSSQPFRGTIHFRLLAADGTTGLETTQPVVTGGTESTQVPLTLPAGLVGGHHVLNVEMRDQDGISVEWGAWVCTIHDPLHISSIQLSQEYYIRNEPIGVDTRLLNNENRERDVNLRYTIRDTFDRDVYRMEKNSQLAEGETSVHTTLQPDGALLRTDAYWVILEVFDKQGRCSMDWQRLYVPIPATEKHRTYWGGSGKTSLHVHPHLRSEMAKILRPLGLRVVWASVAEDYVELDVENNLWASPENIINTGSWNRRFPDGIRTPCLSDPAFLDACTKQARDYAKKMRKFGIIGYSSQEEMSLNIGYPEGTTCLGPLCAKGFSDWLRTRYKSLHVLNDQWNTTFQKWRDVTAIRWEDGAKDLNNPARWVDFRTFMETVFAKPQTHFNRAIREGDPGSLSGYNGIAYGINPFSGIDRTRLAEGLTFSIEYQDTLLDDRGLNVPFELLRDSIPEAKISSFVGYTAMENDHDRYWYKAWWMAFRQMYAPVYYTLLHEGDPATTYHYHKIHQTYAYNTFTQLIADSTRALMQGLGKLIMESHLDDFGIAIYYSQPSMMRRYFEEQTGVVQGSLPLWDIRRVIKDLGLHYRRLNTFQLMRGKATDFSVLILPDTVALGDGEWGAIQTFLDNGGTVIAFARTGLTDRNGKVRTDPRWAMETLGVQYRDEVCTWRADTMEISQMDGTIHRLPVFRAEPDIMAEKHGKVMGRGQEGNLVFLHKRHGEGNVYYLHCADRFEPSPESGEFILSLLEKAGITRPFQLLRDGKNSGHLQCFHYLMDSRNDSVYVGILHSLTTTIEEGTDLTLQFESPGHLYDLLKGEYLGHTSEIQATAPKRGRPLFYAKLGHRVEELHIQFPGKIMTGDKEWVEIKIASSLDESVAGTHIFRVEILDPSGKLIEPLSGNHVAGDGRLALLLDVPYNATPGEWTIQARDVPTGVEAKRKFFVTSGVRFPQQPAR